jgi:hypothetical protein
LDELRQSKPPATKVLVSHGDAAMMITLPFPEQDRHRWSTQIPLLLHAQAVVIAAAAVSAARSGRFSLRIRGIADRTSSCDSCPQSAVIQPSF